jgi:hypothetical protein
VSGSLPAGDADGVIGAAMFQRFLLRFNAGAKRLELLTFPDGATFTAERPWHGHDRVVVPAMQGFARAVQLGHLLLVREKSGYFIIDTGAAFSALSFDLARGADLGPAAVRGLSGSVKGAPRMGPLQFRFAREPIVDASVIALDLRETSRQEGVEISGLIGYPALMREILTIDYRDGLVDIAAGP